MCLNRSTSDVIHDWKRKEKDWWKKFLNQLQKTLNRTNFWIYEKFVLLKEAGPRPLGGNPPLGHQQRHHC